MCSCDGVSLDWNSSPVTPSIAAAATDRACTSSPTLVRSENTGASPQLSDRPSRQPLLGNPRTCVSEAPAYNPPATLSGHSIPSSKAPDHGAGNGCGAADLAGAVAGRVELDGEHRR